MTETDEQILLPFDPPLEEEPAGEIEALRVENESLRVAVRLRDARDIMTASLSAAGARSSELLFEAAKDSLQFGEDGSPQNAEALVADLKRRFPEQFGAFPPQPPIDGGAGSNGGAPALTKESLARMTPAEIARLDWGAVREVLAN
jgi:hypothetical protein